MIEGSKLELAASCMLLGDNYITTQFQFNHNYYICKVALYCQDHTTAPKWQTNIEYCSVQNLSQTQDS